MKKLVLILALFIGYLGYSQKPYVDVIRFRGELDTAARDALIVPVGERWLIWNTETNQLETKAGGGSWTDLGGADNLGDHTATQDLDMDVNNVIGLDELRPWANGSGTLGTLALEFNTIFARRHIIGTATTDQWQITSPSDGVLAFEKEATAQSGTFSTEYTLNEAGPTDATDLVDKNYVDGLGFVTNSSTTTFTNKSIDATTNTITNIESAAILDGTLLRADMSTAVKASLDAADAAIQLDVSAGNDQIAIFDSSTDPYLVGGDPNLTFNGTTLAVTGNATVSGTVSVATETYDATGWNGDLTVPTKDAIRDQFESLTGITEHPDTGQTGIRLGVGTETEKAGATLGAADVWISTDAKTPEVLAIACSDLTTNVTTGTSKAYFRMPWAATLTGVKVSLLTAGTSTGLTVDINEAGTTILSTKLTTDATEATSATAATPAVISDSSLANDAIITFDFDAVPTGGKGVIVYLYVEH